MNSGKPQSKQWVLIVDDDPDVRDALQLVLESWGWPARTAANGREALDTMSGAIPALVLVDLMMPVMSGAELVLEMRRTKHLSDIPVVLVTAWPDEAEALGTQGCVSKPIDLDQLLTSVGAILPLNGHAGFDSKS